MMLRLFIFVLLIVLLSIILNRNVRKRTVKRKTTPKDGREFESFLYELFKKAGYQVRKTGFSRDFAADLLIENRGKLVVLQAKYYNKPIDKSAVEEAVVAGTIYGTKYVGVVTNNEIPDRVKDFARQFESKTFVRKIYLIDGKALERLKRGEKII